MRLLLDLLALIRALAADRARLTLEIWPNKKRVAIYLPRSSTVEHKILLNKIYKMSNRKLQKYWVLKMFDGAIPTKPAYVPSAKAAGKKVRTFLGALAVVDASKVPEGVRVLLIAGKKPGQKGYPLTSK